MNKKIRIMKQQEAEESKLKAGSPQVPGKKSTSFLFHATIIGRKQPYFQTEEDVGLVYIIQCEMFLPAAIE